MKKPCRNSRWTSEPKEVTLSDGTTIVERSFELTPGYGRTNVEYARTRGFNPDMQADQYEQKWGAVPDDDFDDDEEAMPQAVAKLLLPAPVPPSMPLSATSGAPKTFLECVEQLLKTLGK